MPHAKKNVLSASLEDYLEVISHLEKETRVARAKDIADRLGVSRASVTSALKGLAERNMINYEPYSYVTLTEEGKIVAGEIIRRHETLREFFCDLLRLSPETAEMNACRVEHAVDGEAMERISSFMDFMKSSPHIGEEWRESFERFCKRDYAEREGKQAV